MTGSKSDGVLTVDAAAQALPKEEREMVEYLIGLMRRFELCFPLDEAEQRWLVPQLLSRFQPALGVEWTLGEATRVRYRYDVLTEGLLPRFIVRTHPMSEGELRWRNGVVLRLDGASALVRAECKPDQVTVSAIGDAEARLRLVKLVRGHFAEIHSDLPGLNAKEEVEVEGYPGVFKSVKVLELDERGSGVSSIETEKGSVKIDETAELNRISAPAKRDPDQERVRLFVSYSHKDARLLDIFRENLDLLREDGLVAWWYDGLIMPSSEWDTELRGQLKEADIVVLLVSTPFLGSRYIRGVELARAAEYRALGENEIATVLLEPGTSWKDKREAVDRENGRKVSIELGKYQAMLPNEKCVRDFPNLRIAFNHIEQALRGLIGKLLAKRADPGSEEQP